MKKFVFITGALSLSLTSLGVMFKMVYMPIGSVFLMGGIGIFAIAFVPGLAKYLYDKLG